jgi:hypothetical protein
MWAAYRPHTNVVGLPAEYDFGGLADLAQQPRRPSVPVAPQILKVHQIHDEAV